MHTADLVSIPCNSAVGSVQPQLCNWGYCMALLVSRARPTRKSGSGQILIAFVFHMPRNSRRVKWIQRLQSQCRRCLSMPGLLRTPSNDVSTHLILATLLIVQHESHMGI